MVEMYLMGVKLFAMHAVYIWLNYFVGKVVLLKDLGNIRAKLQCGKSRNNLDESVKRLKDTYGKLVGNDNTMTHCFTLYVFHTKVFLHLNYNTVSLL